MATKFKHFPARPRSKECQNAWKLLQYAHESASSFLDIFDSVRRTRHARGAATDEEQDLLRAMLVTAGAGLDSMTKHLIRDALPTVIKKSEGAAAMLKDFVVRSLKSGDEYDTELLASALLELNAKEWFARKLIDDLTGSSLQSAEQLLKCGAHFDIRSQDIISNVNELKNVFKTRNQIIHEMDINFSSAQRNRIVRGKQSMITNTNRLFEVGEKFLKEVDKKITN